MFIIVIYGNMENIFNLSKVELQELAKTMRQKCTGSKTELCQRILAALPMDWRVIQHGGNPNKEDYFIEGTPLDDKQKSYCRCILHTASKQPEWCLKDKAWRETRDGQNCYNPYAICTKSVGRKGPAFECTRYYNLDKIPETEVKGLANLKGKSLTELRVRGTVRFPLDHLP